MYANFFSYKSPTWLIGSFGRLYFWVYVGRMLEHLGDYMGFQRNLWGEKTNHNQKPFGLEFILGAMLGRAKTGFLAALI